MQAYEHIWTLLAISANRGQTKEQALKMIKEYGAYATLTDSIRSELNPTEDGRLRAYRPLSHYSDGAWMELPYGENLKNFKGLEDVNYHMPDNAERKAADGPTDIKSFIEHNQEFLKDKRSSFTLAHLLQDTIADRIIQKDIATTYYTSETEESDEQIVQLYGYETKGGLCKFNKTNKVVSMDDFRKAVTLFSTLTSVNLWRNIKDKYPDLTVDEVAEATKEAYLRDYNENMVKSASQYIRPSLSCEKFLESDTLDTPVEIAGIKFESIEDIKKTLVEMGAFNNEQEVSDTVEQTIRECANVFNDGRTIESMTESKSKGSSINNIVFDFGGVLCDFKLREYYLRLGYSNDDIDFIEKTVFWGPQWQRGLDLGTLTLEQMRQELHQNHPEKVKIIDDVLDKDMEHILPLRPEVMQYIEELKKDGFKVYGLSNCSEHVVNCFSSQYPGFEDLFDGITASYKVGAIKPASKEDPTSEIDTTIYDAFFRDNNIRPSTALFIDDSEHNINVGQMLGMPGVQWTKHDTLDTIKEKVSKVIERSKQSDKDIEL